MSKQATATVFGQIEENRQFTGYYDKLTIPATPAGNQVYRHEIGDQVTFSSVAPYRGEGKVVDRYIDNGFCYYTVQVSKKCRLVAREKDLKN